MTTTRIPTTEVNLSDKAAEKLIARINKCSPTLGYDVSCSLTQMIRDYNKLAKQLREIRQ